MVVGIKDTVKLIGIAIVACCAVFVCTLFLNYNIDIAAIENKLTTEAGIAMYNAQVSMGKATAAVTGGCLVITSIIMLLFYIKNYIDTHGKELGILKALGYSNIKIAKHFWVFGLSVLMGCVLGFVIAFLYLPTFYDLQNAEKLFSEVKVQLHPMLILLLVGAPAITFSVLSVLYAYRRLLNPVPDLLKEKQKIKVRLGREDNKELTFLKDLKRTTLTGKKTLVFFIAFSAFCFSAMMQMSMSMNKLASENFAFMIITIGLILAFMTLFMSLSSVVKGNTKTIAMMMVFGYDHSTCSRAILGGYRPFSYIGFAVGTIYQYALLKIMVTVVFADVSPVPEYSFDFKALVITLAAFSIAYELIMYCYSLRIRKLSVKSIMME